MAKKAQRDNAKRQPKHKTGVRKRSAPKRPRATASADAEPVREVLVDGTDNETNVPQAATDARVSEASSGDAARAPRGATAGDGARGLDFTIAGVGASAGGLEAFSKLLRAIPPTANAAIVYVQHLAPRHESSLAALLGQSTSMPVVQVTDRMPLKPGTVYVIPPNTFMSVSRGFLRLAPRPLDRSQHLPVDYFLRSLAEFAHDRAVGVILSGTDSDGAAGLREIKAVGGIALAQEPDTAKFDGMPRAAISTGAVDKILPPEEIAAEIARLAQHPLLRHVKARTAEADVPISQEQWRRIFVMLRGASGVDFTHYKQPTLRRRLQRRMLLHKIATVDQYLQYLQNNPGELSALYQDILIHVTRFFREPESYEVLTGKVFPQILRDRKGDQPIRIWVPGCSTGEEAYSVAISLLEFLGDDAQSVAVQVFATDVSESAVEQARGGLYPQSISSDISPERLRRFFTSEDGKYRISKSVRDTVIFARQDLTRDPPFSKLDLIVCRNVLIYLGPVLQ
ncbi:MAG TPA: chemotaxis protein CheB, partial [Tepidisphaeraceae bacterium]|nr:chemotaxis protein CheB [Tepidisphaeraceae bacterium]